MNGNRLPPYFIGRHSRAASRGLSPRRGAIYETPSLNERDRGAERGAMSPVIAMTATCPL